MMGHLYFSAGFAWNYWMMFWNSLPMSLAMGRICAKRAQWPWAIDEIVLLQDIEDEAESDGFEG